MLPMGHQKLEEKRRAATQLMPYKLPLYHWEWGTPTSGSDSVADSH